MSRNLMSWARNHPDMFVLALVLGLLGFATFLVLAWFMLRDTRNRSKRWGQPGRRTRR